MSYHTPQIRTDTLGGIFIDGKPITYREAIETATRLCQAVENATYRGQVGTTRYHSSEGILERANRPLGQAIAALKRIVF